MGNKQATVNYNAYDTWLEPYIGWDFKVLKVTKNYLWFFMDYGWGKEQIICYKKSVFDVE